MESLFTKLYKYRQRENKSDLENFSTELLAHCLKTNKNFQKSFLKQIGCTDDFTEEVSTQQSYPKFGRPDIEISTPDSIILIENKVESLEGFEQLNRYVKILSSIKRKNKYLIYLTKFYEHKEINEPFIEFRNIKWWDVYKLINDDTDLITFTFSEYLIENRLAMDKNFKNIDLVSLENIGSVIAKMDEVIDSVKNYFNQKIGALSKDSSRSTRLSDNAYYNYKSIGNPFKFSIEIGYFWWWEDNPVYFGMRIWIPYKNTEKDEIINFFRKNLDFNEWDDEPWEKTVSFGNYKKLNEIISTDEEQLPQMIYFLKENIDTLHNLKNINPEIFE